MLTYCNAAPYIVAHVQVLYCAKKAGVTHILKAGGAQVGSAVRSVTPSEAVGAQHGTGLGQQEREESSSGAAWQTALSGEAVQGMRIVRPWFRRL